MGIANWPEKSGDKLSAGRNFAIHPFKTRHRKIVSFRKVKPAVKNMVFLGISYIKVRLTESGRNCKYLKFS